MSAITDYIGNVKLGIERAFCVQPLVTPIYTIKTIYQCSQKTSYQITQELYQKEGIRGLYRGLPHQLVMSCVKQVWVWPFIVHFPPYLKSHGVDDISQQVLTGATLSLLDSIVTPLEKGRIQAIVSTKKIKFSIPEMCKNGWQGYSAHLAKLSAVWIPFLLAQKHFRDQYDRPLTLSEQAIMGVKTSIIVSTVCAPVDFANTVIQAENRSLYHLFTKSNIYSLYRGWHLNAASLLIHNIASSIVMEKLSSR